MTPTAYPGVITAIARIVEEACAGDGNVFGYSIWTHHITRVAAVGKHLAELRDADPEIVEIAGLLHDYASIKDVALYADHHRHGPVEAERVLRDLDYPQEKIEAVKECIAGHRGSVPGERRTPEAVCLADADALTHIASVPALLCLAYVTRGMSIDAGADWVQAKLERSWHKLSPAGQELAHDSYQAALRTLGRSST